MLITGFLSYHPTLNSKILFEIKSYVTLIFRTSRKCVLFFKTDSVTQDKMASWHGHAHELVSENYTSSF